MDITFTQSNTDRGRSWGHESYGKHLCTHPESRSLSESRSLVLGPQESRIRLQAFSKRFWEG